MSDTHLEELRTIFAKQGVVLAYLFGSQAEGTARPDSDWDFAVLLPTSSPPKKFFDVRLDLTNALMDFFRKNEMDVVVLNEAPLLLAREIARYGHIIYEDPVTRPAEQFMASTMQRYLETQPMREARNRDLYTCLERRITERALRERRNAQD
jgi:hypothetical protein